MNIGLDFDDVIVDTYEPYFAYAQKYTIEKLKREPIIDDKGDFASSCYCTFMHNWTQEEEDDFWRKYVIEIEKQIKVKTFAKETINQLKKDGHKIIIITAREGIEEKIVNEQLEKENIIVDKKIFEAYEKGKIVKENNIDIFIDDNYKHCKAVAELGIKTYIMDARFNRNIEDKEIKRVYSWPHLYYEISNNKI